MLANTLLFDVCYQERDYKRKEEATFSNMENTQEVTKKKKLGTIKRMIDAYNERKRKEKVEKLMSNDNHWKGLS